MNDTHTRAALARRLLALDDVMTGPDRQAALHAVQEYSLIASRLAKLTLQSTGRSCFTGPACPFGFWCPWHMVPMHLTQLVMLIGVFVLLVWDHVKSAICR